MNMERKIGLYFNIFHIAPKYPLLSLFFLKVLSADKVVINPGVIPRAKMTRRLAPAAFRKNTNKNTSTIPTNLKY